jgi:hypothetical protein
VIAPEHLAVAVDVDLPLPDNQPVARHAFDLVGFLPPQNVVFGFAVAMVVVFLMVAFIGLCGCSQCRYRH